MTKTIRQLDSLTIDKIAAGEVIESPASCIKELIDNALDADAHSIFVDIQLGGRDKIVVRDDGKGMSKEDLLLSCQRHATSKISSIDDLERLTTLGFRGEALSSIASIAKVTLRSRERGTNNDPVGPGAESTIEGGEFLGISDIAAPFGTQITVHSLFYNVPARRKFLKSPSQNALEVLKVVKLLALIAPKVAFTLITDGKEAFHVPSVETLEERIKAVLKEPYSTKSLSLSFEKPGISIGGLIALPECAKKNRSGQYLFVNGRPVTSNIVSYTVRGAYSSAIASDVHPQFAISLILDPDRIDVNVHPQKKEIRFADEEWIRAQLYEAVGSALFATLSQPILKSYFQPEEAQHTTKYTPLFEPFNEPRQKDSKSMYQPALWQEEEKNVPSNPEPQLSYIPHLHIGRFFLATLSGRYVLIDIVRALSATLTKNLTIPQSSSLLLTPEMIEFDPISIKCIEDKISWFHALGYTISVFGNNTLLIEGIPSYLEQKTAFTYIQELLDQELAGKDLTSTSIQEQLVAAAIKSLPELKEDVLNEPLARRIVSNWITVGAPLCTVTGKKVCIPFEPQNLISLFE